MSNKIVAYKILHLYNKNMSKTGYVYILTNNNNTTLYVGVTSNLETRIWQHKHNVFEGFTKQYNVHKLVYFEDAGEMYYAICREKQIKGWTHKKKVELINSINNEWKDLSKDWGID